jgi:hypothetical protein
MYISNSDTAQESVLSLLSLLFFSASLMFSLTVLLLYKTLSTIAAVCHHVWRDYSSSDKFQETRNVEKLYEKNKRSKGLLSVKFSNIFFSTH